MDHETQFVAAFLAFTSIVLAARRTDFSAMKNWQGHTTTVFTPLGEILYHETQRPLNGGQTGPGAGQFIGGASQANLVLAQRNDRIHLRGPARRNVGCQHGDRQNEQRNKQEEPWFAGVQTREH